MSDPAPERTREGELLVGKYRLEQRLGAGGMGEVYRARNEKIGRTVAIKLLRPEWASNAEIVARFLREAHAANLVRHPNVVDVLDVGQDATGGPFIVQEFLQGRDLSQHLEEVGANLTAAAAVQLILPVLDAIGVAHEKGVVHRDLKPENVFLARSESGVVPKVLDFGISKVAGPDSVRMTATGVAMGTPLYMSPEQIQGARDVDARTDVWSLGVMLFELLSHTLPFDGNSQGDLFVKICTESPPDLRDVAPQVPDALARVVMRCLERNPNARFANAAELAHELRAVVGGLSSAALKAAPSASPARPVRPRVPTDAATVGATPRAPTSPRTREPTAPVELAVPPRSTGAVRRAFRSFRPPPRSYDETPAVLGAGFVLLLFVGILGIAAMTMAPASGWPVMQWWERFSTGISPGVLTGVALGVLVAAAALIVQVMRASPPSLGLLLSAAGLIVEGYFLGRAASTGSFAGAMVDPFVRKYFAVLAPWALAAVPAGLGFFGLGRALDAWRYRVRGGRVVAVFLLNLALLSLFASLQIARGVIHPHASVTRDEGDEGGDNGSNAGESRPREDTPRGRARRR